MAVAEEEIQTLIKKMKMVPLMAVIFVISFISLNFVQGYISKIDIKEKVVRVTKMIAAGKPIPENSVKTDIISKDWLSGVNYIKGISDIKEMYAKEALYPGDIIRTERIGRKNEITRYELKPGNERISVRIQKPENAVSFQFKTMDEVSLDCVIDYDSVKDISGKEILTTKNDVGRDGEIRAGQTVVRLIDNVKILALCDKNGNVISDEQRQKNNMSERVDSAVFDVTHENALLIHALRKGVFEITKIYSPGDDGYE